MKKIITLILGLAAFTALMADMPVQVKTLTGVNFELQVDAHDDVSAVRKRIADKLESQPDKVRIIHAGRQLKNGEKLSDHGITKDAVLHVVFKR